MSDTLLIILLAVGSYFFGNINNALIISKFKHKDVRKLDSGNPGTMNMIRNFGIVIGGLTLLLDVIKGVIPCLIGWFLFGERFSFGADKTGLYVCALCLVIGHIYPVFLKFKGGKGIASTIGVCLVIQPWITLITFAVGFVFLTFTKMGAATSFIIISLPLIFAAYAEISAGNLINTLLLFTLFMLPLIKHLSNIIKLFGGRENKTVLFKKKKSK